jgi:hypothetical protein
MTMMGYEVMNSLLCWRQTFLRSLSGRSSWCREGDEIKLDMSANGRARIGEESRWAIATTKAEGSDKRKSKQMRCQKCPC